MKEDTGKPVLLVGNPNVGKSVIFSYLTGRYAIVSNYPGTTVELSTGHMGSRHGREVLDTPGINSLFPASEDEKVTRDIIFNNPGATVVQVVDAKNIYRALTLTTQLAEAGCRMILVLNMMDEARQRGLTLDARRLSALLAVPVIETVAVEKRGLSKLVSLIDEDAAAVPAIEIKYPALIEETLEGIRKRVKGLERFGRLGGLTHLCGDDEYFLRSGSIESSALSSSSKNVAEVAGRLSDPFSYNIARARKRSVDAILRQVSGVEDRQSGKENERFTRFLPAAYLLAATILLHIVFSREAMREAGLYPAMTVLTVFVFLVTLAGEKRMDRFTLHPVIGLGILAVVVYMIYQFVGVFAAGRLVDLIETNVFDRLIIPGVKHIAGKGFIYDILVGRYGLVSMGLSYSISIVLPIVLVFFLIFGILEDTGYFPRLTVLTNNAFKIVGVNGKATLPVVLGFGCVTMAILASRILETKRERIIVITLLSLAIPCSAQLGVMLALMSAISIAAVITISLIVLAEFLVVGSLLGRIIKGETSDFILELPPLRIPRLRNIVLKTGARAKWFLVEAVPYFILATVVLFFLDRTGAMDYIYKAVEPVASRLLGLPVETASVFIIGFFRRDYGAAGLYRMWQSGLLTGNQITVALTVMSLFLPCLASLIVMIKELGIRYAMLIFLAVMVISILTGGALNLVLSAAGISF